MDSSDLLDRQQIADLMAGWIYRDTGEWEKLRKLFHPDATIEVLWFSGKASDFVDGSMKMVTSSVKAKHMLASSHLSIDGGKAVAETNAMIVAQNWELGIGCESHIRFYDRLERRAEGWRISQRHAIYDLGSFTLLGGTVHPDQKVLDKYPVEYQPLGYVLEKSGVAINSVLPTKGSDRERDLKAKASAWLVSA